MKKANKLKLTLFVSLILITVISIYFVHQQYSEKGYRIKNITSAFIIESKGETDDKDVEKYWVLGRDPNSGEENLKIIVEDINVWNLLDLNREYYITYESTIEGDYVFQYVNPVKNNE